MGREVPLHWWLSTYATTKTLGLKCVSTTWPGQGYWAGVDTTARAELCRAGDLVTV